MLELTFTVFPDTRLFRSEEAILCLLRAEFPEHRLLSEETDATVAGWERGWVWVIDPIDGAGIFARCIPTFAVNIALLSDGDPVLGLTVHPVTGDEIGRAHV